jgi:branched-chain amino acid transport system substrate-binding protein
MMICKMMGWVLLLALLWGSAAAAETIRVGATVSQTGHFAAEVGPFKKLFDAWSRDVGERGGLRRADRSVPLQVTVYDDRSDEATARRMYERLALADKVNLMIGPYSSPLTFAASGACQTYRIPFVAVCANSPKIYNRGNPWIVCIIDEAARYTHRYWEMIAAEAKAKTVAFVVEDGLHPRGVAEGAAALAAQAGVTAVGWHMAPPDHRDFTPIVVALKQQRPDIVLVASNIAFGVQFVSQARELDLAAAEFHVIHHGGVFRRALGAAAEGITGQSYWAEGMNRGQSLRFKTLLEKAGIHLEDYPWSPAYMMAFETVEAALAKSVGTSPEELIGALKTIQAETIGGTVRFAPNGVGSINTYPSQIQNGRYQIIWPPPEATAAHIYGRP